MAKPIPKVGSRRNGRSSARKSALRIPKGVIHVQASFNNTIVSVTDVRGDEGNGNYRRKYLVQEFARLKLEGDVFSSPVMIGGRTFVGSRDDYLHCIAVETRESVEP